MYGRSKMNDQTVRARRARTITRHREGQGAGMSTLRAAGDVFTTAEGNGKTGG